MPNLVMFLPIFFIISLSLACSSQGAQLLSDDSTQTMLFQYHKGPLLIGKLTINLVWYSSLTPFQRAIVSDFISSLSSTSPKSAQPSVATWWKSTHKYYLLAHSTSSPLSLGKQILDPSYSLGKLLTSRQIGRLALRAGHSPNSVNVVLTSDDVAVDGFCSSTCGNHGLLKKRVPYVWVGNSAKQCPGQCAWPFHQPIYGPQGPPLVAPNNDAGVDGMVINLACPQIK